MLRFVLGTIGGILGGALAATLLLILCSLTVSRPAPNVEPLAGLWALVPTLFLGLPAGAYLGVCCSLRFARFLERRFCQPDRGISQTTLAIFIAAIVVLGLGSWWLMELYGGW